MSGDGHAALRLRVAAAALLLLGLVSLAAPGNTLGTACGSPLSPQEPTAAQAWNDVYELQHQVERCPRLLFGRLAFGAMAVFGGLALGVVSAIEARPRSGRTTSLAGLAISGMLVVMVLAPTTATYDGLRACGTALAVDDRDEGCGPRLVLRWVLSGGAALGAIAAGSALLVARRRPDEDV